MNRLSDSIKHRGMAASLVLLGNLLGCGQGGSTASVQLSQASSHELYAALFGNKSERSELARYTAALPIKAYYQSLLADASDQSFSIDGLEVRGSRAHLLAAAKDVEALAIQYPTVGAYWSAIGVDPSITLDERQFTNALKGVAAASSQQAGLSLTWDPTELPSSTYTVCPAIQYPPQATGVPVYIYQGQLNGQVFVQPAGMSHDTYRRLFNQVVGPLQRFTRGSNDQIVASGQAPDGTRLLRYQYRDGRYSCGAINPSATTKILYDNNNQVISSEKHTLQRNQELDELD